MKVKIQDLEPNPFRDMDNYPIDQQKTERLAMSIKQTGFWDNILARKKNGKIQIAYGHHRLMVLKRDFKPDHIVDIPVKELDDDTMLRIMANENMQEWDTSVAIINETIRTTYEFLKGRACLIKSYSKEYGGTEFYVFEKLSKPKKHQKDIEDDGWKYSVIAKQISSWLGGNWIEEKVWHSLDRLKLFEVGVLDKKAIEKLPTDTAARHFAGTVKRLKDVTPDQQRKAAERIIETQDFSKEGIEYEILEEKLDLKEKRGEKEREFEVFIAECSKLINSLNRKIDVLIDFKSDFDSKYYKNTFARFEFDGLVNMLQIKLKKLTEVKK